MGSKWHVDYPEWGKLAEPRREDLAEPVEWLSAFELWRAAVRHLLSTKIGEYVDRREFAGRVLLATRDLKGIAEDEDEDEDEGDGGEPEPVWIDFVADVGDGYRASFAVAQSLDSDHLYHVDDPSPPAAPDPAAGTDPGDRGETRVAPRGSYLIFGGDLVYPWPSLQHYEERFQTPYRYLLHDENYRESSDPRKVLAIPGNHDWYDGLAEFSNMLVFEERLARCPVPQKYSYWAIRPHPAWQVWGVDIALVGRPDSPQLAYFHHHGKEFGEPGSELKGLVVCIAKPFWEEEFWEPGEEQAHLLARYLWTILPGQAERIVFLSGDRHYLAAWGPTDPERPGSLCVTAGGGGAYHLATAAVRSTSRDPMTGPSPEPSESIDRLTLWPEFREWKRGTWWRIPRGVFSTPSFVTLMGIVYALLALVGATIAGQALVATSPTGSSSEITACEIRTGAQPIGGTEGSTFTPTGLADVIHCIGADGPIEGAATFAGAALSKPFAAALLLALVAALVRLARSGTRRRVGPAVVGFGHALAHVAAITAVAATAMWAGSSVGQRSSSLPPLAAAYLAVIAYWAVIVALGALVGALVFSVYLAVALRLGLNLNETSIVVSDERWKNYLRLRLSSAGIEVLAFGIPEPVDVDLERGPLRGSSAGPDGPIRHDAGDPNVAGTRLMWRTRLPFPGSPAGATPSPRARQLGGSTVPSSPGGPSPDRPSPGGPSPGVRSPGAAAESATG